MNWLRVLVLGVVMAGAVAAPLAVPSPAEARSAAVVYDVYYWTYNTALSVNFYFIRRLFLESERALRPR
jgi:hypothetical protein